MPKEEWGVKRACPKCTTRFYDLQKDPMTCPACGAEFTLESLTAPAGRTTRTPEKEPAPTEAVKAETTDDADDVEVLDDDDDADVDLGDDILEDDEDDNVSLDEIADMPEKEDDS